MEKNEKELNDIKISAVINIIIFILTILSSIIMFTGFKFMPGKEVLESTRIGMMKFFTVDSNIFMGIIALMFAIKDIQLLKGKISEISANMYVIKLMATVGVGLTFLTVFGYLGFVVDGGIVALLNNSNLFFHLLIPALSILIFVFCEKTDKLKLKHTFIGIIPVIMYAVFYLINVFIHMENGIVPIQFDWYGFARGGVWQIAIVFPLMLLIAYLISFTLWKINKKKV